MAGLQTAFLDTVAEKRSVYADLDQALAVAKDSRVVSFELAEMILEAESPVDVAYHLGKNPDLARALSQMPPQRAAYELGRLEAKLNTPKPKITSSAPDPISPVRPSGVAGKNPANMNAAEYRTWRESGGRP
jgi:hypothetical protein